MGKKGKIIKTPFGLCKEKCSLDGNERITYTQRNPSLLRDRDICRYRVVQKKNFSNFTKELRQLNINHNAKH